MPLRAEDFESSASASSATSARRKVGYIDASSVPNKDRAAGSASRAGNILEMMAGPALAIPSESRPSRSARDSAQVALIHHLDHHLRFVARRIGGVVADRRRVD